jgi:hypothetical protein
MAKWHSRYGIPVSAHPHAVGLRPTKDVAAAGGAGYKCVSPSPFKRYAVEDRKLPLRDLRVGQLTVMLHGADLGAAKQAATELMRRHKNGRHMILTKEDRNAIRQLTGYFKPAKQTRQYRKTPADPVHRRIF